MSNYYSVRPGYIIREIAGEYLAVPVCSDGGSHIVILNPVSKFLWERMQEKTTVEQLVCAVVDEYGISADEAESDINDFINQLKESNLLN